MIVKELEAGRTSDPEYLPAALQPLFSEGLQRFMIDLFSYDPAKVATHWTGPVLIVQGTADIRVKPRDADLLVAAMPRCRDAAGHTEKSEQCNSCAEAGCGGTAICNIQGSHIASASRVNAEHYAFCAKQPGIVTMIILTMREPNAKALLPGTNI